VGTFTFISFTKRKRIISGIKSWHDRMKIEELPEPDKEEADQEQGGQS
jgi:hypothetical protein